MSIDFATIGGLLLCISDFSWYYQQNGDAATVVTPVEALGAFVDTPSL